MLDEVCTMYYIVHIMFGNYVRSVREGKRKSDRRFSLRQVARRIGIEPAYLSKVERNEVRPPSEAKICLLADELEEDPDALLALAGKVRSDVLEIIRRRPKSFAQLVRRLEDASESDMREMVKKVKEEKR